MGLFSWFKKTVVSNNTPKRVPNVVLSYSEIRKMFLHYTPDVFVADRKYAVVDATWLMHAWYSYYCKVIEGLKIEGWRTDFDCDNYAGLYKELIQACHYKSETGVDGIAVGVVRYVSDAGGPHQINVAICGKDKKITFMEPQNGLEQCLSQKELRSIFFVSF